MDTHNALKKKKLFKDGFKINNCFDQVLFLGYVFLSFYRKWPNDKTSTSQRQPGPWASTSTDKTRLLWRHKRWRGARDPLLVPGWHECPK